MSTLYSSIIRPVLEYASITWNPWLRKDISAIDSIQRKCEKLCRPTERLRFEALSVRHRTDLIETYKYINNKYKTPPQTLFLYLTEVFVDITKRFSSHMQEPIFTQKYFFSHRVVEPWNLLSSDVIDSDTVDSFRRRLMRVVHSCHPAKTTYRPSNQVSNSAQIVKIGSAIIATFHCLPIFSLISAIGLMSRNQSHCHTHNIAMCHNNNFKAAALQTLSSLPKFWVMIGRGVASRPTASPFASLQCLAASDTAVGHKP